MEREKGGAGDGATGEGEARSGKKEGRGRRGEPEGGRTLRTPTWL